jgi:ketosteroid isomerase-like protein
MSTTIQAVEVVQSAYAAFGRGELSAILSLIADDVEWKFYGSKGLPYTGTFRTKDQTAKWFASISEDEDILVFEPRELIPAGDNVTVPGWERTRTQPGGKVFETECESVKKSGVDDQ